MIPCLIVTVAALFGFLEAMRVRYLAQINSNSCKAGVTSSGSCSESVYIIPFSSSMEDRISELPDEILYNILSCLSLRDVVRMATLSRRWRDMCLKLPYLNLDWHAMSGFQNFYHDKECKRYRQTFVNNVEQVLLWYNNQDIKSLRFSFCFDREIASAVDGWIKLTATKRCLESLTLQFICTKKYFSRCEFGINFYTFHGSFLSDLPCLKGLYLDSCILKLQNDNKLTKLVTLDLSYVILEGSEWQTMVSGFSAIEWLRLRNCNLPGKLCIGNNLWNLRFLMIDRCPDLLELEVNARNLKTFEFIGEIAVRCSFPSASKLENMYIYLMDKMHNGAEHMFRSVSGSLFSLKTLYLDALYSPMHKLPINPARYFRSVLRLHLLIRYGNPEDEMVMSLPRLLRAFPQLEKLCMHMPFVACRKKFSISDVYHHVNLREVELFNFDVGWTEVASYLLRSAAVLDRMMINKYTKAYVGCGTWSCCYPHLRRSECEYVRNAFRGKALSPNVDLILYDGFQSTRVVHDT